MALPANRELPRRARLGVRTDVREPTTDVDRVVDLDEAATGEVVAAARAIVVGREVDEQPRAIVSVEIGKLLPTRLDRLPIRAGPAVDSDLGQAEFAAAFDVRTPDV